MPKAKSAASTSEVRSTSCQYTSISFRSYGRSTGTLRRNQACKQCRKRKSKCDAGRPCKACLRAHAVVVANLVKRGLPLDSVQPECVYDCDSSSEHSSPAQPSSSPVELPSEPQEFQPDVPAQPAPLPQYTGCDTSLFSVTSPSDTLGLSLHVDTYRAMVPMSDSSPQTASPYFYNIPGPQDYCYQLPQISQAYQSLLSPRLFESDLPQLHCQQFEWMYQDPQIAPVYSQVDDCDVSQAIWDRQL